MNPVTRNEITRSLNIRFWFWIVLFNVNLIVFYIYPQILVGFMMGFCALNLILTYSMSVWFEKHKDKMIFKDK